MNFIWHGTAKPGPESGPGFFILKVKFGKPFSGVPSSLGRGEATRSVSPKFTTILSGRMDVWGLCDHARPFVGASRVRCWSHWFVLGAISWAFIAESYQNLQKLTFD